jgi:hypothetical protein
MRGRERRERNIGRERERERERKSTVSLRMPGMGCTEFQTLGFDFLVDEDTGKVVLLEVTKVGNPA